MANLLLDTKRLLSQTDQRFEDIAEGAGVRLSWLYMFARDEIPNPGVLLVQKVHDYLVASPPRPSSKRATPALSA